VTKSAEVLKVCRGIVEVVDATQSKTDGQKALLPS
jgi:hypothetical protein